MRRLRGRFGIAAPQVTIRTHAPWHLRAVCLVVGILCLLALVVWVFDAGRRLAGFDYNELGMLRSANAILEQEITQMRNQLTALENSLQIELSAQKLLSEKNSALVEENARLKEELAVIERLSKGKGKMGAQ